MTLEHSGENLGRDSYGAAGSDETRCFLPTRPRYPRSYACLSATPFVAQQLLPPAETMISAPVALWRRTSCSLLLRRRPGQKRTPWTRRYRGRAAEPKERFSFVAPIPRPLALFIYFWSRQVTCWRCLHADLAGGREGGNQNRSGAKEGGGKGRPRRKPCVVLTPLSFDGGNFSVGASSSELRNVRSTWKRFHLFYCRLGDFEKAWLVLIQPGDLEDWSWPFACLRRQYLGPTSETSLMRFPVMVCVYSVGREEQKDPCAFCRKSLIGHELPTSFFLAR